MVTWEHAQRMAAELGVLLKRHGKVLVCAESCTGGLLAAAITSVAGSSYWFDSGLVSYSNESKMQLLGVHSETLSRFGAVSEETAMEMASGVLAKNGNANTAISITGIAGPSGATAGKPVGMVCFALARRHADSIVSQAQTQVFSGNRDQVRYKAVIHALSIISDALNV